MTMPKATRGKRDFIFQRPGSSNFYVKLRSPDCRIEKSLGTADRAVAEIRALPMIAEHKRKLYARRARIESTWHHKLEPGREHVSEEGGKILATDRELFYIGRDGAIIRTEPNGGAAYMIVGSGRLSAEAEFKAFDAAYEGVPIEGDLIEDRPRVARRTSDDGLFQTYIDSGARDRRGLDGYARKEAQAVWDLFRTLVGGKALKECTRDDGRLLVAHYKAEGLSSPSMQKKIMWLSAMVQFSIEEKKLPETMLNPFSKIVPQRTPLEKRAARRKPFDDEDLKACKARLGTLSNSDQLLFRLLEGTGMRLSEAFQIEGEEPHNGVPRFVVVGNKTENSLRRVPFPKSVLPYLPAEIQGRLFEGLPSSASHRFTTFLRETVGITDPKKVLYSLRHRAKDRLRELDCPEKISEALFGRDEPTIGDDYGKGFPIVKLKTWVDKISTL
jgi:integrase